MAKLIFNAGVFKGSPLFAASTATQITVLDRADDTLASLWSDRDGTTVKSNPFFVSSSGKVEFYADPGRYRVTATAGGHKQIWEDVLLIDPAGGGGGGSGVASVVAGDGVNVDSSDTANPVVSSNFSPASTSASYTLSDFRNNQWIDLTGSADINITCPEENDVPLADDFVHVVSNYSTGSVTIVAAPGVTVRPPPGGTLVIPQYATVGIRISVGLTNTYIVFGPTVAAS